MDDTFWMHEALKEAEIAFSSGEVPIGAVVVKNDQIISSAHNQCATMQEPTRHAESVALRDAFAKTHDLSNCTLYVTVEPCAMCAGTILLYGIPRLVFGAYNPVTGCCGSRIDLTDHWFDVSVETTGGVLEKDCREILSCFFQNLRSETNN